MHVDIIDDRLGIGSDSQEGMYVCMCVFVCRESVY